MSISLKVINNVKKRENFYCNLCNYPLLSKEDFELNEEYNCCEECFLTFVESRKQQWEKGWRPEKSKLDSYILVRNKINRKEIK